MFCPVLMWVWGRQILWIVGVGGAKRIISSYLMLQILNQSTTAEHTRNCLLFEHLEYCVCGTSLQVLRPPKACQVSVWCKGRGAPLEGCFFFFLLYVELDHNRSHLRLFPTFPLFHKLNRLIVLVLFIRHSPRLQTSRGNTNLVTVNCPQVWMRLWMVVCLDSLALWRSGDSSTSYRRSPHQTAGIRSSI